MDRLDTRLRMVRSDDGISGEIKWKSLSEANYECYIEFVDTLFESILSGEVKFRQMFLDRTFVWQPKRDQAEITDIESQFKLYYQFLKHAFGLKYLPRAAGVDQIELLVRLDNHSSQPNKEKLVDFCATLPRILERHDVRVSVSFLNSKKAPRIQVWDLLIGAAGSHGNRMHLKRSDGQRGMTKKQKLRDNFCKHVYQSLKNIDAQTRGSKAFNWFETTGLGTNFANFYEPNLRIRKFIPKQHLVDAG